LTATFSLFFQLEVLKYDSRSERLRQRSADDYFRQFRQQGIRIGTQDLRIASIALAHGVIIVTRNQKDFGQVPGLTIEDWSLA
jgi:tRNA(fMet)-specific endonuclease VapC